MNSLVVVDDERAFAEFVAAAASAVGYEVTVANSVDAFRRIVEDHWPSVLVTDLQMPGCDGIELIRELGERGCSSKIILLSGTDARVLDTAFRLGSAVGLSMAARFSKPVRARVLKEILDELRDRAMEPTAEALAAAIDAGDLFLLYQPKIAIPSKRMIGVEALVRWKLNTGRVIPPASFIPLAESSGLIDRLTWWVVKAAFQQASAWHRTGLDIELAVNLSAINIHDRHLPDGLVELSAREGVEPERVTLELTETASNQDLVTLLEVLGRFRLKGFRLSIDDFGTGYSSVAQLLRLPFSELKIDKSFVTEMDRVPEAAIVARTLIHMAHDLGLRATAEGVERLPCLQMLSECGCDIAQGYLFSKPVNAAAIAALAKVPAWV